MKFKLLLLLLVFVFNKHYAQRIKLSFGDYPLQNISVRAIEIENTSTVWFAGSGGKYGRISSGKLFVKNAPEINGKTTSFRSIAFNGSNLFILSIEDPAILYRIDKQSDELSLTEVYREDHPKVFYDSMTFLNKKEGIAMGDPTETCLSVIISRDGGQTWKKQACSDILKLAEGEAAFAASNTNLSTYKNKIWMVTGGKKARVFRSKNKGKTWKAYNTPIVQGDKMTGIYSVDFNDSRHGIIMGGNWDDKNNTIATKAITKNGGKTWKLISNNEIPGYISCVQYVPDTKGKHIMAVSTEGIFHSSDSGDHWEKLSDRSFYTIRFINKNTAWLAGNNIITMLRISKKRKK